MNAKIQLTKMAAHYAAQLQYEDLPEVLVQAVKVSLRDYIACLLGGRRQPVAEKLESYLQELTGPCARQATIAGGKRYPLDKAALLNGTMSHALDFDDCQVQLHGHPSVAVWPAILTLAEEQHATGKELITAYVAGMEVMCKLCGAMEATHYGHGWHATGTGGAMGAAIGAAKIMKLTEEQTCNAIGLAASMASGVRGNFGSMTKPLHAGMAARNGVNAVLMTLHGVEAKPNILEKLCGYVDCFSDATAEEIEDSFRELGQVYSILMPGLKYKAFPCCNGAHPPMCAALKMRERDPRVTDAAQVKDVTFYVQYWQNTTMVYPRPKTALEGKFSAEYCVARVLVSGKAAVEDFTDEAVTAPEVLPMLEKSHMVTTKDMDTYNALPTLVVTLNNGEVLEEKSIESLGHRLNPMSEEQFIAKFMSTAVPVLGKERAEQGLALLAQLTELDDCAKIPQALY